MFIVNGIQYDEDLEKVLEDVRDACPYDYLHTIRNLGNNIQFTCPFHADGQERKPSCGVNTVDVYRGGKIIQAGTVHCFTCGTTMSIDEMISYVFGKQDGGQFGNKWLRKMYNNAFVEKKREFKLQFRDDLEKANEVVYIEEDVLETFRYIHPYMYKRGLTDDIIELFDIGYDSETTSITMPVKDLKGRVVFIQRRSVRTKFHNYARGVDKTDYVYGAYECLKYYPDKHTEIWICESILNCLTLWRLGVPAVALMGVGGGKQYEILKKLPYRNYVLALDPDSAGRKGQAKLFYKLFKHKSLARVDYLNENEDINDLDSKVLDLDILDLVGNKYA